MSVKARIFLDGEEVDLMEFASIAEVQPGKEIELADALGVLSGTGSGPRYRVGSVTVVSEVGAGDTLADVEVRPL